MLRFLLKTLLAAWFGFVLLLLAMLSIGKTAPESSKIAFFQHRLDATGTDYWRLDLFSGIAFKDAYLGFIFIPANLQAPMQHILSITSNAYYYSVFEVNLYNQEQSFVARFPTRGYTLLLAGDYIFTYDLASQWRRIHIEDSDFDNFGSYSRLDNPQVSPDGQWLVGRIFTRNLLFINVINARTYELSGYSRVQWSPDSQWFFAYSEDFPTIAVFNSAHGTLHPSFPRNLPASVARWSYDSQAIIFYRSSDPLSLIRLDTNEIHQYPNHAEAYELDCLSPNQMYILTWEFETVDYNINLALEDLETGQKLWRLARRNFSGRPQCLWSGDSRYLSLYLRFTDNGRQRERFFVIDTLEQISWNMHPDNLFGEPIYLHIPD